MALVFKVLCYLLRRSAATTLLAMTMGVTTLLAMTGDEYCLPKKAIFVIARYEAIQSY